MNIDTYMSKLGSEARAASRHMASASTEDKNTALLATARAVDGARQKLLKANALDMQNGAGKGLDSALLDRLELTSRRIDDMIEGLEQVASLPDPVASISSVTQRPSGIQVGKMRVPLGVIGIIYESRPNVTAEAASLCIKSGNAAILRGGSEALQSNQAIAECLYEGLRAAGLPGASVQVLEVSDREAVGRLITMPAFVDVIVPRGGKGLIERISQDARVPVIKHLDGNCHVYIDEGADLTMAMDIAINAKTQRYGTCNTMETLLVAQSEASALLPKLAKQLQQLGVEIRGCSESLALIDSAVAATEQDWYEEYLGPILAVKVVEGVRQAIDHINTYSSQHTEAIVTTNHQRSMQFLREVDSSSVMINASTRFADGFEYGLGAEIGISTDKIHVRGPVGLEGLTTEKWIVFGDGQTRS